MGHTPYGYRIENGCAVINEDEAAKIRNLYENYLAGMAQSKAAIEAGIEAYHSSATSISQPQLPQHLTRQLNIVTSIVATQLSHFLSRIALG